jgi:hypothetical protein
MTAGSNGYIRLDSTTTGFARDEQGRVLNDASHVQQHLPPRRGIGTTVVPAATPGGIPQGSNPHMVDDQVINYRDGDKLVKSATVRTLRDEANNILPTNTVVNSQIGKVAYAVASTSNMQAQPDPQYNAVAPPAFNTNTAVAGVRPLQMFNQNVPVINPGISQRPTASKVVTFDVTGFGSFQAPYADVLVQGNTLVLVFDHVQSGQFCYFPDASAEKPPETAIIVQGDAVAYKVEPTGIRFKHGTIEYFVLFILQSVNI